MELPLWSPQKELRGMTVKISSFYWYRHVEFLAHAPPKTKKTRFSGWLVTLNGGDCQGIPPQNDLKIQVLALHSNLPRWGCLFDFSGTWKTVAAITPFIKRNILTFSNQTESIFKLQPLGLLGAGCNPSSTDFIDKVSLLSIVVSLANHDQGMKSGDTLVFLRPLHQF